MVDSVQLANTDFTFSNLTLANPQGLQGGAYFSKLRMNNEPVLIQTPKCSTKNGIHKTEKKIYCDLMFTEDNNAFIQWVHALETTVKDLIYEKRNLWFHNDMEHDSIDYHWQNLLRTYKGNKSLLRCFINKSKGLNRGHSIQIYNEEEEELQLEDLEKTTKMISILEVSGLKFTSQSFQIEFIIKQMMVIKDKPLFNKCLIKFNTPNKSELPKVEQQQDSDADSDISIEEPDTNIKENNDDLLVEEKNDADITTESTIDLSNNNTIVTDENPDETNIPKEINKVENKDNTLSDSVSMDISENSVDDPMENLEKVKETHEQVNIQEESLDKNGIMNEIEILPPSENADIVKLKNPNEVYMEIYKEARRKAKDAKKHAIQAYLEAKRIKSLYLLDEIESSDDDIEFEDYGG